MVSFIDRYRGEYGVEPICKVLPIAPSTYHAYKVRQADPAQLPARAKRDIVLRGHIRRVWLANRLVYGVKKVWKQLKREGLKVARCTVARLMRQMGLFGAVRGKKVKTTIPDTSADRPLDLVARDFNASRPNELWVSDLTYVATCFAPTLRSTPWSRRSGLGRSASIAWSITATAVCNTSRSATPSVWLRPGSSRRSEAGATRTTTRWRSR
jgi:transposase InsO family protein